MRPVTLIKSIVVLVAVGTVASAAAPLTWSLLGHDRVIPQKAVLQPPTEDQAPRTDVSPVLSFAPFGAPLAEWMLTFLTSLLSMMNPLGNVGIFATMTSGKPRDEVSGIARKSSFAMLVILLVSAWFGAGALAVLGINVDELRTAGGLIIGVIGMRMLFNNSSHAHTEKETRDAGDSGSIAIVPVAIPLVAGPGTISLVVAEAGKHGAAGDKIAISAICAILCLLTGLVFSQGQRISKFLGTSGMAVVTRIMGMVLVAMATGMLADGVQALIPSLAEIPKGR